MPGSSGRRYISKAQQTSPKPHAGKANPTGIATANDVLRKGKILIPNGSALRGRIRRLERYQGGGAFIVGLEFTEVAVRGGGPLLFYADLLRIDKNPRIKPTRSERVLVRDLGRIQARDQTVTLPELPGVASFFVSGMTFTIPSSFRMVWRTRGPIR